MLGIRGLKMRAVVRSQCQILTPEFLNEMIDFIDFEEISYWQHLTEDFIEKWKSKLNMGLVKMLH